jgi:hypothetical protein
MVSSIIQLLDHLNKSRASAPNGLAAVFAQAIGLEWGWVVLMGGAFLVVGAGLMAPRESPARITTKDGALDTRNPDEIVSHYVQMIGQSDSTVHASGGSTHLFGKRANGLPRVGEVKPSRSVAGYLGVVVLVVLVSFVAAMGAKEYLRREQVTETAPAQATAEMGAQPQGTQQPQSAQPAVMRGADLYGDHDRLIGQRVRVRGKIYGASGTGGSYDGALLESEGANFVLRQVSSDVMRRMLEGCSVRSCMGALEVTPAPQERGDAFPRLTNPTIIENK